MASAPQWAGYRANSQKGAEGAAIGGAVGLLIGQMLDNKAAKKARNGRKQPILNKLSRKDL